MKKPSLPKECPSQGIRKTKSTTTTQARLAAQAQDLAQSLWQHLEPLPLQALARASGFCRRKPKKLSPEIFVQAACLLVTLSASSYRCWAGLIGLLGGCTLSKQALWERCTERASRFLQATLQSLVSSLHRGLTLPSSAKFFGRVLLQDSTTVALSPALARCFPGARNQRGTQKGLLKIQAAYDLRSQQFVQFSSSSFRRNDQAASADVLSVLRAGDLVIRDLGYFVLEVLEQIAASQGYFLSRLRLGVSLWSADGRRQLSLLALLRRYGELDRPFCLGDKKVAVRLIAVRLPAAVAAQRRRLARQNRDRRSPPSAERLALLGWALFITNIPAQLWSARTVARIYGLRWRIEVLFKAWKSPFGLREMPAGSQAQVQSLVYAKLLFITLFQVCFARWQLQLPGEDRPALSLLKVAQAVRDYLLTGVWSHLAIDAPGAWRQFLDKHCRYERRNRRHFLQELPCCSQTKAQLQLA